MPMIEQENENEEGGNIRQRFQSQTGSTYFRMRWLDSSSSGSAGPTVPTQPLHFRSVRGAALVQAAKAV